MHTDIARGFTFYPESWLRASGPNWKDTRVPTVDSHHHPKPPTPIIFYSVKSHPATYVVCTCCHVACFHKDAILLLLLLPSAISLHSQLLCLALPHLSHALPFLSPFHCFFSVDVFVVRRHLRRRGSRRSHSYFDFVDFPNNKRDFEGYVRADFNEDFLFGLENRGTLISRYFV